MKPGSPGIPFSSFSVIIVFTLLCLIGIVLIPFISVQFFSTRNLANITVSCYMPGASPEAIESKLTSPIESILLQVKGVKNIYSESGRGGATITLELNKWAVPEESRFEAATLVRQLYPKLPEHTSYPLIYLNRPEETNAKNTSILNYSVSGPGQTREVTRYAEEYIRPALSGIQGISRIDLSGVLPNRLELELDEIAMARLHITYDEVSAILRDVLSYTNAGNGYFETEAEKRHVVLKNSGINATTLLNATLCKTGNRIYHLSDIARARIAEPEPTSYYRINGNELVNIAIYPDKKVNTLVLATAIKTKMESCRAQLPKGYDITGQYDASTLIKRELTQIYIRTGLSVSILLLFILLLTRQIRYIAIVIASLAANVLLSFILYYLLKLDIHIYTLAGITIAMGMVIDNCIVIIEDIRHTGRNRIFTAILASTLTALGALSVIFFLDGEQKINLLDFAIAVIINLLVSLPIAFFLIPALLEKFPITLQSKKRSYKRKRLTVVLNRFYSGQICFIRRYKTGFIILIVALFGLPVFLLPAKLKKENRWSVLYNNTLGSDMYNSNIRPVVDIVLGGTLRLFIATMDTAPDELNNNPEDRTILYLNIHMPNGAIMEQMNSVAMQFEHYLQRFKEIDIFTCSILNANEASIEIKFKDQSATEFPSYLEQLLQNKINECGAADFKIYGVGQGFDNEVKQDRFDMGITLKGYNYDQLFIYASRLKDSLKKFDRVRDIVITTRDRWAYRTFYEYIANITRPDMLVLLRTKKERIAKYLNNNTGRSSALGNTQADSVTMAVFAETGKDRQLSAWNMMNDPVLTEQSSFTRLRNIATIKKEKVGESILKENQEYILHVFYQFLGDNMLSDQIQTDMVAMMDKQLPFGYSTYSSNGTLLGANKSNYKYLWLILLVLAIIYVLCAVLLESLLQPLAVIAMIPFSFIGVFIVFHLFKLNIDQGGYAALLMLCGVVTNAALYIINDINSINKSHVTRNICLQKIYLKAFSSKIGSIMITTASAVLSMLPFMLSDAGKDFWFTISAGTIGGLVFSILGVYLLLPVFFQGKTQPALTSNITDIIN